MGVRKTMSPLNLAQRRVLVTGAGGVAELLAWLAFVHAHLPSQTSDISVNRPLVGTAFVTAPAVSNLLAVIRAHGS